MTRKFTTDDIEYLCEYIASLMGIPVRYYHQKKLISYYSSITFQKDIIVLHQEEIDKISDPIAYYMTEDFIYYAILQVADERIVIGPSFEVPLSKGLMHNLGFALGLSGNDLKSFEQGMQSILPMPLQSTLKILCALYFAITGDKTSIKDVTIDNLQQNQLDYETTRASSELKEYQDVSEMLHNTYSVEQTMLDFVRHGNVSELIAWANQAPSIRPGLIGSTQLRQSKNTFIVSATLASRAAIDGGLNIDDALSLSDLYIQKCETLDSIDRILNLQFHMILDFATQVQSLRFGDTPSAMVLKVSNYIRHHISESISTEDIANALFLSRGYLSTTFKKETGMPLSGYITSVKIDEAKRLLLSTNKSLAEISAYLGFSSQSHFSTVFQKYEGISPSQFRKKQGNL